VLTASYENEKEKAKNFQIDVDRLKHRVKLQALKIKPG